MSDISFSIHILASVAAICASYALIMNVLKKEMSCVWVRGTAVLALLAAGISFGFSYTYLLGGSDVVYMLSIVFLLVGLTISLAAVIRHRLKLPPDKSYPKAFVSGTRTLAIIMFASFTLHFLLELAALTRL